MINFESQEQAEKVQLWAESLGFVCDVRRWYDGVQGWHVVTSSYVPIEIDVGDFPEVYAVADKIEAQRAAADEKYKQQVELRRQKRKTATLTSELIACILKGTVHASSDWQTQQTVAMHRLTKILSLAKGAGFQ